MSVTIEASRARQDEATESYHQCWFPVALASDVPAGRPLWTWRRGALPSRRVSP